MMICRFNHGGICCNSGATQCMNRCKLSCDTIVPITNAERIRSMSDEELAQHFAILMADTRDGVAYSTDEDRWFDWLQQPAEECE